MKLGRCQLNDIEFIVPPDQISIQRKSYNNFWQTLRTRSSQKLRSGFAEIQISMILNLVENDLPKLTDFVSQIRVTPFVWVENEFIRKSILNDATSSMVLALQQMEIMTVSGNTNRLQVALTFVWFNYLPYSPNFRFREDIFSNKSVPNPVDSRAWKLLYTSEQARKYEGRPLYRRTVSLDNAIKLATTQFVFVDKAEYTKLNDQAYKLKAIVNNMDPSIPLDYSSPSEFTNIDSDLREAIQNKLNDSGINIQLANLGDTTSMGSRLDDSQIRSVLEDMILDRECRVANMKDAVSENGGWTPVVLTSDDKATVFQIKKSTIDSKKIDIDAQPSTGKDQVLKKKDIVLNFEQIGLIPIGLSLAFNNILARVPLIGHQYPTYQHIGSVDAVFTLSLMTTEDTAVKELTKLYALQDSQAHNYRWIPSGQKNLRITNTLVNACGLNEFIFENMSINTVKGQPGTTSIKLTLIDNPITRSTKESLESGVSFTTNTDIRQELFNILSNELKFNPLVNVSSGFNLIATVQHNNKDDYNTSRNLPESYWLRSYYKCNKYDDRNEALGKLVDELSTNLRKIVGNLIKDLQSGYGKAAIVRNSGTEKGMHFSVFERKLIAFLTLTENDVTGITRIQEDVWKIISQNGYVQHILTNTEYNTEPDTSYYLEEGEYRTYSVGKDQFSVLSDIADTILTYDAISNSTTSVQDNQYREYLSNIGQDYNYIRYDLIRSQLSDWNKFINDFLDNLSASPLLALDIFDPVRNLIRKQGLKSTSNAYPDFPLNELYNILQSDTRYTDVANALNDLADAENLGIRNISPASALNPDFYLYPTTTGSQESLISPHSLKMSTQAILKSTTEQRHAAEKDWLQNIYIKHVLGADKAKRVQEARFTGLGSEKKVRKIVAKRQKIMDGDNEGLKKAYKTINDKIDGSYFLYPEAIDGGSITSSIIASAETNNPIEIKHNTPTTDIYNQSQTYWKSYSLEPPETLGYIPTHYFDPFTALQTSGDLEEQGQGFNSFICCWPLDSHGRVVTSEFSLNRSDPVNAKWNADHPDKPPKSVASRPHKGIDIAFAYDTKETEGQPILSATTGTVVTVSYSATNRTKNSKNGGTGVHIVIKYDREYSTRYLHMQWDEIINNISTVFWKKPGWKQITTDRDSYLQINLQQQIGSVGNTGRSQGAHLHFEVLRNNKAINPKDVLRTCYPQQNSITSNTKQDYSNPSLIQQSVNQLENELITQGNSILRAYPTYKLYFIESDLGERSVFGFDDFFSYSHVTNVQMIRSRKIPADLCVIQLTNVSGILSNRKFEKIEKQLENGYDNTGTNTVNENKITSLMLQPGTQIQLRLGYDNNPDNLDVPFNGVITDVQFSGTNDVIQITCQSFAIELVQNVMHDPRSYGGHIIGRGDGWTGNILEDLLSSSEVVHFGHFEPKDTKAKKVERSDIIRSIIQDRWTINKQPQDDNIFAPYSSINFWDWTHLIPYPGLWFPDDNPDYVMYNTTIWDVAQEMTLRHPGYIMSTVPYEGDFGPRMTMYFGLPDQLYRARDGSIDEQTQFMKLQTALDKWQESRNTTTQELLNNLKEVNISSTIINSIKNEFDNQNPDVEHFVKDVWVDRFIKKAALTSGIIRPFRSYHILTSSHHIINNSIVSSNRNTFNTITLQYEDNSADTNTKTGTLEFDDVETLTLSCETGIPDNEKKEMFAQYPNCIGANMARHYSAALLKSSLKEGYRGEIIVMGNPSIKPYDICYIYDEYNEMYGQIEVEQVVHKFNQQDGFITSITPDMVIHTNETVTMSTEDAMGLVSSVAVKNLLHPINLLTSSDKSDERTATATSIMNTLAKGFDDYSAYGIALSLYTGLDHPTAEFIFKKVMTVTQLGQAFRYSPLVMHTEAMLGGLPIKHNKGSFIQGVGTWFHNLDEDYELYADHLSNMIHPNNWFNPTGNFLQLDGNDLLKNR